VVTSTLPAFSAIVLYTKQVSKQFDTLVSQAATGLFCHVSRSEAGERKGSSPSTMSFDLCRPVRHRQVHITLSSERLANPSVTRERERTDRDKRKGLSREKSMRSKNMIPLVCGFDGAFCNRHVLSTCRIF